MDKEKCFYYGENCCYLIANSINKNGSPKVIDYELECPCNHFTATVKCPNCGEIGIVKYDKVLYCKKCKKQFVF